MLSFRDLLKVRMLLAPFSKPRARLCLLSIQLGLGLGRLVLFNCRSWALGENTDRDE